MFDLAKPILGFLGLEWWKWVLVGCLVVIIVAYLRYRKTQV